MYDASLRSVTLREAQKGVDMNDDLQPDTKKVPPNPLLILRNARHRAFWAEQEEALHRRLAVPLTRAEFCDVWLRQRWAPKEKQETPYVISARVEARQRQDRRAAVDEGRRDGRQQFAAKGGKAKRHDDLQELIVTIVLKRDDISEQELLDALERRSGEGVIEAIAEGNIEYATGRTPKRPEGQIRDTPIGALRSRLTRARKEARRRHAITNQHL